MGWTMRNRDMLNRYGPSGDFLFNGTTIFDVLQSRERMALDAPTRMNDDALLNTPTDDLVAQIVAQYAIDVPVLDRAEAWIDTSEGQVAVRDYWSRGVAPGFTLLGTIIHLHVPFSGDGTAFEIQPASFTSGPPRARVTAGEIVTSYSAVDINHQEAKAALDGCLITSRNIFHGCGSQPFLLLRS
jgi:hypothetical protein